MEGGASARVKKCEHRGGRFGARGGYRPGWRIGVGIGINYFLKFDIGSIGAFLVAFIWILYLYFSII